MEGNRKGSRMGAEGERNVSGRGAEGDHANSPTMHSSMFLLILTYIHKKCMTKTKKKKKKERQFSIISEPKFLNLREMSFHNFSPKNLFVPDRFDFQPL